MIGPSPMPDSGTSSSARLIALCFVFAVSAALMMFGAEDTPASSFILTVGTFFAFAFGLLLFRELAGSLRPSRIRSYLLPDSADDD